MKKVIYGRSSEMLIHANDVDNGAIIGYISRNGTMVKGFLVKGKKRFTGVNVCLEGPAIDTSPPVPSHDMVSLDLDLSNFMQNMKHDWDFFKFGSIKELINWLAS